MSVLEIEKNIDELPKQTQAEILHHLLGKHHLLDICEDFLDIQKALEARKEGGYVDYMEFSKELFGEKVHEEN